MYAEPGDWLVVESRTDHHVPHRGEIREVHGTAGQPPYLVRWAEDGHEGLVFPGPDAQVLTPADLAARDTRERERIVQVQQPIDSDRQEPHGSTSPGKAAAAPLGP